MKSFKLLTVFVMLFWFIGCVPIKLIPPTSIIHDQIENYKYFYISSTNSLNSSSGATIGGQYYSSSQSVNPSDVISGILSKQGIIKLPELVPELSKETIVVNYGESGRRSIGLGGYTIEVTIQFVSAKSIKLISSCTAEGLGSTEADDIRIAITRCMNELIQKKSNN